MVVTVANMQRKTPVRTQQIARLARCAIKRLRITTPGTLAITLLEATKIRRLNKRFLRHDRPTDVLSFRYDGEPVVGEIFIAPSQAKTYASTHGLSYHEELSRYVVHGLLHWLGEEDRTKPQQARMRRLENRLLKQCQHA